MFAQPPDIDRKIAYLRGADVSSDRSTSEETVAISNNHQIVWENTVSTNVNASGSCVAPTRRLYAVIRGKRSLSLQQEPENESRTRAIERGPSLNLSRVGFTKLKVR